MKLFKLLFCVLLLANCGTDSSQNSNTPSLATYEKEVDITDELFVLDSALEIPPILLPETTLPSCETNFDVYVSDPGEDFTNVRNAPNGDVIMELSHGGFGREYMLTIIEVKDGWFKFEGPIGGESNVEVPGGFGWIHNSVVTAGTRNYGRQVISLFELADESSTITGTIETESEGLKILDACEDWVLIELSYDNYYRKGWMKTEWCCGNPFTTCA